ncbi:hypothetical protein C0V75_13445 [Tabrizicola sp. TH137]|uniref:SH3 domain-containing protein n=1 Tax=Tabrizicola sp. TH137 TaxID=2067452 RepID=UPI000C7AE115|nr:SH3 domain-containing protein [Tabrizicola sp. TH137]PLL11904.1 hypothetical protein C0V75_13445 [Tabrizicola sp. TH137]
MFRYLLFCSLGLYLALLIGGEDRGQERMGLRGAYAIDLSTPAPMQIAAPATQAPATPEDARSILPETATATRTDSAATPALLEQAAAPAEPAFNDFNNPSVTLRTITAEAANIRDAASRNGAVIGRLERGEIVQMVEQVGDWVHIRIEGDGIDGYVHRRLISTEAPALSTYTLFPAAD